MNLCIAVVTDHSVSLPVPVVTNPLVALAISVVLYLFQTHQPQANKGITCPKPFNLTESRKRKISQSTDALNDSYHSTAEKLRAFEKQTPDRFRSKPRGI